METTPAVRVDKWLWAVRLFRTRTAAATACQGGKVKVNGVAVKPARSIRPGDVIEAKTDAVVRTVRVRETLQRRVGAPVVPRYLEDLTPESAYAAAREENSRRTAARPPGAGRPTKRDRRILQSFFGDDQEGERDPHPD